MMVNEKPGTLMPGTAIIFFHGTALPSIEHAGNRCITDGFQRRNCSLEHLCAITRRLEGCFSAATHHRAPSERHVWRYARRRASEPGINTSQQLFPLFSSLGYYASPNHILICPAIQSRFIFLVE